LRMYTHVQGYLLSRPVPLAEVAASRAIPHAGVKCVT